MDWYQKFDLVGTEVLLVEHLLHELSCAGDSSELGFKSDVRKLDRAALNLAELLGMVENPKLDFNVELGEQPRLHLVVNRNLVIFLRNLIELKMKSLGFIKYEPDQSWTTSQNISVICRFPRDFSGIWQEQIQELVLLSRIRQRIMIAQGHR